MKAGMLTEIIIIIVFEQVDRTPSGCGFCKISLHMQNELCI